MDMTNNYTVHTQHGIERTVRTTAFSTYEAALEFATADTPDTDGSLCPNVDDDYGKAPNYEQGIFWMGNRYAVILRNA